MIVYKLCFKCTVILHMWHGFVILTILASCIPLADTVCVCVPLADTVCVCVMFVVRRRCGILRLVVYCWRCRQSNGYEELPGGGEEEGLVSDRIGNLEAYPRRNLSSFACPPRKDRKQSMKTGSEIKFT